MSALIRLWRRIVGEFAAHPRDVDRACAHCGWLESEHVQFVGCDEFREVA